MPFGLKNTSGTLKRAIYVILTKLKWLYALVHLHYVIIFSPDVYSHFQHVANVLQILRLAGLILKLSKSFIYHETVDYLGHVIHFS